MNQDQLDLYREILPIQRQRLEIMRQALHDGTNFVSKIWLNYQIVKLENYIVYIERLVKEIR